jgi:hypothetical protein
MSRIDLSSPAVVPSPLPESEPPGDVALDTKAPGHGDGFDRHVGSQAIDAPGSFTVKISDLIAADKEREANNKLVDVTGGRTDFVNGVSPEDIQQGGIGDCYLLASLATLAKQDPDAIRRMIKNEKYDADGNLVSCQVHLFVKGPFGIRIPVDVDVDCRAFGANAARSNGQSWGRQELWPLIIEKAYAQLNADSYNGIGHGGWPNDAMETLTGKPATRQPMGSYSFDQMQADLKSGKPISFSTEYVQDKKGNVIPGKEGLLAAMDAEHVHGGHAYAILDCKVDENGQKWVKIYNPWGYDHPGIHPGDPPRDDGWIRFEDAQKLFNNVSVGSK